MNDDPITWQRLRAIFGNPKLVMNVTECQFDYNDDKLQDMGRIRQQRSQLRRSIVALKRGGFRHVFVMESPEQVDAAIIERTPLWNDKRDEHGPFDFIGDVHGCCDELEELLVQLGDEVQPIEGPGPGWSRLHYVHPEGRKAVFGS